MTAIFNLVPEAVDSAAVDEKDAVLQRLARQFALAYGLDQAEIFADLLEREALGSTGFGRGVAIPHARSGAVSRPTAALLRLEQPVDFVAADGLPVDLVIGLLSPRNSGVAHLHALAAISRLVRSDATHRAMVDAPDAEALYALIANATDRDAA